MLAPVSEQAAATDQVESEAWRELLINGHRPMRMMRAMFRLMPGPPRCKVCSNPFSGPGGAVCKLAGFKPSRKNPNVCARCCEGLPGGGATVDVAVLFADVRGSTTLGEQMAPVQFAGQMSRFYRQATSVLLAHGAIIDKLTGDGVMALFIRGIAGSDYRAEACKAAIELQVALTRPAGGEAGLPVGIGLHAGEAFVGNLGAEMVVDFTALGDTVNTAARLQSVAKAGEAVFSEEAFAPVAADYGAAEARTVSLRGKQEDFRIRVLPPPA
jgi:adenylate cyclase